MTQKMRQKLKRAGYRSRYRLRKQIVEPVFGQIKQARGFRQFLLRGLEAVQAEWALICPQHHKARQGDLRAPISNPHAVQTLSGRAPRWPALVLQEVFCPLPTTIVHFLIQVKPPTNAKSNDGVSSFSRRNSVSDPKLLRRSMPRDTWVVEHHSLPNSDSL
jgi:Transposase DDE domain